MHAPLEMQPLLRSSPSPRLWLFAGTGEGPPLVLALLGRGWRLRVSVVTASAARAYPVHPALELQVGPLGGSGGADPDGALAIALERAARQGDPFTALIDASHPFAVRISAALARVCGLRGQPLLRLRRPLLPTEGALLLDDLNSLGGHLVPGDRLLLAIGARRLPQAIACSPGVLHHARILPNPQALQQARAAGLPDGRLACLRPGTAADGIERGLCLHWRIEAVLCRQSGGTTETLWRRLSRDLGLRLLLLRRPAEPRGVTALSFAALLERIGAPPGSLDCPPGGIRRDAWPPAPAGMPGAGDPAG